MTYTIDYLGNASAQQKTELAAAYKLSYITLSAQYKSPEEMALYTTNDYFMQRVEKFAKDPKSTTFIIYDKSEIVGFSRFSPVPEDYLGLTSGISYHPECGTMDGHAYQWKRPMCFDINPEIDDKTLMLHQIYLVPKVQHQGLGTQILASVLPTMAYQFNKVLVEYNMCNHVGEECYKNWGFKKVGETQDLDHILPNGKWCTSSVGIAIAPIDVVYKEATKKLEKHRLPLLEFARQRAA